MMFFQYLFLWFITAATDSINNQHKPQTTQNVLSLYMTFHIAIKAVF